VTRVDRVEPTLEAGSQEILEYLPAHRTRPLAGSDERYGPRVEEAIQGGERCHADSVANSVPSTTLAPDARIARDLLSTCPLNS
jgi:hypothetical protein